MSNKDTIENKISLARKYLARLEVYKKYSREEIENDQFISGSLERYLYLVVQATLDTAESIIAYRGLRKPATLREEFEVLSEAGIINRNLTTKLMNMVGFRNVVAHDYTKLDYDIVHEVLHNRLEDIEEFLNIVEKAI